MKQTTSPIPPNDVANDPLLASLNPEQQAAVVHTEGPLLVLAGAGSGKTRVITHRVAWLVERCGVAPWRIFAVTFTNKAAGEMRERLGRLLGPAAADVQVSTFHAAGAAILRREAEKVGRTRSFVIYDDADQLQLLRRALKECGIGDRIKVQLVRHRIDEAKNNARGPDEMLAGASDYVAQGVKKAYAFYEQLLRQADAVDFGDLLLKVVQLFRKDPETLDRYRRRFQYVLVDEFQDTNAVQYELLRLLSPRERPNLCVVGDDDQSIYRWRGADVTNILSFERDFPGTTTVKLERNYRSDAGILEAAYAVIKKNLRRKEKKLWTDRPRGAPFELLFAPDERAEAQGIAASIKARAAEGTPLSDVAVFYRVNAQSRVLEEGLRLKGVPYHVVRGRAFYDRAEIKDAASYLRLAVNPKSDADVDRVINVPARGIGDTTVERLRTFAQSEGLSYFDAIADPERIPELNAAAVRRLAAFRQIVERLSTEVAQAASAQGAVEAMFEITGLVAAHAAQGTEEEDERAENLREFAGAALEFDRLRSEQREPAVPPADPEAGPLRAPQSALEAFLEQISLLGDADAEGEGSRVSLMTLHAAKGLEFDAVYLSGMEEGVFPHSRALAGGDGQGDPEEMAEERRLCYVGITRARKRLAFSLARSRALFGDLKKNDPSRFLSDVPQELFGFAPSARPPRSPAREPGETYVEREPELSHGDDFDQRPVSERRPPRRSVPPASPHPQGSVPEIGTRVLHPSLGEGLVVAASGAGKDARVTVRFQGLGERRILVRFLSIVP